MSDELALLDRARAEIAAGDAARALRDLDEHDRAFPSGALAPEAAVLRIEALAAAGDDRAALAAADRFLAAQPNSAQSRRVRSLAERLRARNTNP